VASSARFLFVLEFAGEFFVFAYVGVGVVGAESRLLTGGCGYASGSVSRGRMVERCFAGWVCGLLGLLPLRFLCVDWVVGQYARLNCVGIVRHTVDEEPFVVLVVPDSFPAFWDPGWWWALCTLAACRLLRLLFARLTDGGAKSAMMCID